MTARESSLPHPRVLTKIGTAPTKPPAPPTRPIRVPVHIDPPTRPSLAREQAIRTAASSGTDDDLVDALVSQEAAEAAEGRATRAERGLAAARRVITNLQTELATLRGENAGERGEPTRVYFDRETAFGARRAAPALTEAPDREVIWTEQQLVAAAELCAQGGTVAPALSSAVCQAYLDLRTELQGCQLALDEERNAHQGTILQLEAAEDDHRAELEWLTDHGVAAPPRPRHLEPAELADLRAMLGDGLTERGNALLAKLGWVAPVLTDAKADPAS